MALWQDALALGAVVAALGYVVRYGWRHWRPRSGCAACGGCRGRR